ncbi:FAD-binding protein [Nocardia terpenica]|uniref:Oxidoreductase n=1 Tax=Nocardia terpenica TaxID=455432 RepID=A0A164JGJ5_9NOCA|nr:D-arabinono-1,4-lactone oxidase [Nocardia terpenica]KZM70382.1 oxidoreductase [Nocardia terpenica]MBF6063451.1 FAD-binding protein [Nocardia terpenica]MBF6106007.1 FAD-binding protein [Nocardia terpenica]MBF6113408.1 FAD-binding protein [Nocardia terpenica]MBF6119748.1 FAD-binding protein [Nocardia terpenica]
MTNSWRNWAGDQQCTPAEIAVPRTVEEVAALLAGAEATGRTVRVAGAGHSFTDTVLTDGLLLRLSELDHIQRVDRASGLVRVEAGATLNALSNALHPIGLAFPNLGDIDVQTVAGATATGTHGTGATFQNLSAALHSVELMLADGSRVELNEASDPDGWRAARVGLGALGVVTAVTLQLVPSFVLEGVERPVPVEELLADLDEYVDGNEHFEFYMFAHSPLAMTKRNNRVELPEQPRGRAVDWFADILMSNYTFDVLCRLSRLRPQVIPWVHRGAAYAGSYRRQVDRSYRVFASPRLLRFTEMEYALPREHSVAAIREIKEAAAGFDTPMPIEVRWVAPDDAFLSPASGRDTCYIAVHQYRGMDYEPYFRACEAIFDKYHGRPHWGKRHFQTAETLHTRYPDWERFQEVRRRLDPKGRFANAYLDRVLGPVG